MALPGGVQTDHNGNLDATTLSPANANVISYVLAPDGVLILLGCNTANSPQQMIDLAKSIGHPVIGNTGTVSGTIGDGNWVEFYPTPNGKQAKP